MVRMENTTRGLINRVIRLWRKRDVPPGQPKAPVYIDPVVLESYVKARTEEELEKLIVSLPQKRQEIIEAYFHVCCLIGEVQRQGSRVTETGGVTVRHAAIGEFFKNLPGEIQAAYLKSGLSFLPLPWSGEARNLIFIAPYVQGPGTAKEMVTRARDEEAQKYREEFYIESHQ